MKVRELVFWLFMILCLLGGGYLGHACNEKFPTPTPEEIKSSWNEKCKKEGAKFWSYRSGCIYEVK